VKLDAERSRNVSRRGRKLSHSNNRKRHVVKSLKIVPRLSVGSANVLLWMILRKPLRDRLSSSGGWKMPENSRGRQVSNQAL
jgi:hypothetical protein